MLSPIFCMQLAEGPNCLGIQTKFAALALKWPGVLTVQTQAKTSAYALPYGGYAYGPLNHAFVALLTYISALLFRPAVLLPQPELDCMRPYAVESLQMPRSEQKNAHQRSSALCCAVALR